MSSPATLPEAFLVALSISADAFFVAFSYGIHKIRIPWLSACIIEIVSGLITGLALFFGGLLCLVIPSFLTTLLCSTILFIFGILKLIHPETSGNADKDGSLNISSSEAVLLSIALSIDGGAVGIGVAMGSVNKTAVLIFSVLLNGLFLFIGSVLGKHSASKLPGFFSRAGGIILILLAVVNML